MSRLSRNICQISRFSYTAQYHFLLQTPTKIIVINANGSLESLHAIYDEKKKTILEMAKEANLKATRFD